MTVKKKVSTFFQEDLPSYAAYDNLRKLSAADDLKISMRKIIYTMLNKYPGKEKIKTDTVANECAAYTNYLHGSANLGGVCDTMAQSFVGSNNYPLIEGNTSGFGTRIQPECSATRYTKIAMSDLLSVLINKDDLEIIGKQFFEGSYIEPEFFVPVFPILFLNGSSGISTGYSQDIYPRDPKEVIKYIYAKLDGKKFSGKLLPWFKGFKGEIKVNKETGKVECWGKVDKKDSNNYIITEIPIGISYQKYKEILDKLCENDTIVNYDDLCDTKTDEIKFAIKTTREFTRKYTEEVDLYNVLKLIKTLPETLYCIDRNNHVCETNKSVTDILDTFIELRLEFYEKRKQHILNKSKDKLNLLNSKYDFCKAVIDGTVVISNRKKADIISNLEAMPNIIKIEDSYNYLLNLPIHSISTDTLTTLQKEIKDLKAYMKEIKAKDIKDMWKEDLEKVQAKL